jgi:hypothetical protein
MAQPTFGSPEYSAVKNIFRGTRWALESCCGRLVMENKDDQRRNLVAARRAVNRRDRSGCLSRHLSEI